MFTKKTQKSTDWQMCINLLLSYQQIMKDILVNNSNTLLITSYKKLVKKTTTVQCKP